MGNQPKNPVQKPQPVRGPNQVNPKAPQQADPYKTPDQKGQVKGYFNYMIWTSKILKQGEIFRRMCYQNNCVEMAAGSGDRRVCKDRCDIETCKKIIGMLRVSMGKCAQSKDQDQCRQRYEMLIPLYQKKLNTISARFVASKKKQTPKPNVG